MTDASALLPDPSARLAGAFRAVARRMQGLGFVNPALEVEAIGFAPWEDHWLGVMLTPWFMNLVLLPRDPAKWQALALGEKRKYLFPAGAYEFIGATDEAVGEYQTCSLFSPVLEFEDQATARLVAELARAALFDPANAEAPEYPAPNLARATQGGKARGPDGDIKGRIDAPLSKRDFLRGRVLGTDRGDRG
jgi:[NiFe] hydrogenase assembly HybE family chaperone